MMATSSALRKNEIDFRTAASLPRLLVIEGYPSLADSLERAPIHRDVQMFRANSVAGGWELASKIRPGMVVLDLDLPSIGASDLIDRLRTLDSTIQILVVSADHSPSRIVDTMRRGAGNYLTKPVGSAALCEQVREMTVRNVTSEASAPETGIPAPEEFLETSPQFGEMVGAGPAMQDIYAKLRRIGPNFRTALVTGATGTGKELVARSLHKLSNVSNRPFVVCNCAAIAEALFESEMFGHTKGAFTGAVQEKPGLFEMADGGTIFLDEIGEIPIHLQSKLLRILQNSELQRIGARTTRKVDVRVIAATNRDLREMARKGQFREDLYYRLNMLEIKLPPLSDRRDDLPLLQQHFIDQFGEQLGRRIKGITRRAQTVLSRHGWPGNIRELQNVIGHACIMSNTDWIDLTDLPEYLNSDDESISEGRGFLTLEEVERRHVHSILAQVRGNKIEAAEILGISRATIYRILAEKDC